MLQKNTLLLSMGQVQFLSNQSILLDNFLDGLAKSLSRNMYSAEYETLVADIMTEIYKSKPDTDVIMDAILAFCKEYPDKAQGFLKFAEELLGKKITWFIIAEQGVEQLYKWIGLEGTTLFDLLSETLGIILHSHYPTVTLAWMRTIDSPSEQTLRINAKRREAHINCPVDVSVYDSKNQLVAQIIDNEAQIINGSMIASYVDGDGQKIVVLPIDEEYRIAIEATDNGTMTYTVEEHNMSTGVKTRLVSYEDIKIEEGDTLTGVTERPDVNQYENSTGPSTPSTNGSSGDSAGSSSGFFGTNTSGGTNSITVPTVTGGKISVSPKSASKGTKVTITATPDQGYQLDSISVVDAAKKQIDLTKISNTQYSFIMLGSKVQITVSFKKIEVESQEKVNPFDDVSDNAYYYDAVLWAVEQGITSGTTATTFSPDDTCTRAQTVTFLWRAAGSPAPASRGNPFTDLKPGAYYYDAVLWAVEQGITSGTTKTTFSPDATVTRGQTVTFLYRAAGSPAAEGGAAFADIANGAYYAKAVTWAAANGITGGTTSTTFSPSNGCTRAQIVTFFYRANN